VTAPSIDNTKTGIDYTMTAGDSSATTPAPKTKKHKKHKKKKKGKGTAPAPAACAPFQAGDKGKDAKTTVVTDAATKDAPVSVSMPISPGLGSGTGTPADAATLAAESHALQNVQVDSNQPSAGLYVRAEFDSNSDDDLFLYNPDGTEAAHAAGFNPEPAVSDGTGTGGHSENGAEQIDGINTADCQGYTAELDGATTSGGTVTFKFWLGDVTWDPSAQPGGLVWVV
jgi:hypothetical protein